VDVHVGVHHEQVREGRHSAILRIAVTGGIPPFHVHRGHDFEGFELVETLLLARCSCGAVLDVADAHFSACPDCVGQGACPRCGGTGRVIDHAALEWRQNVP
jgi:hypothetical protein